MAKRRRHPQPRRPSAAEQRKQDERTDAELHELVTRILDTGPLCLVLIPLSWARRLDELRQRRERQTRDN
jgi:hypothetical protein